VPTSKIARDTACFVAADPTANPLTTAAAAAATTTAAAATTTREFQGISERSGFVCESLAGEHAGRGVGILFEERRFRGNKAWGEKRTLRY
jgi:hypothetical protein